MENNETSHINTNLTQNIKINDTGLVASDKLTKTEIFILVFEYLGVVEYLVCFLANILTITAVVKFEYLHRKSINILILSLCIADSLLGNI